VKIAIDARKIRDGGIGSYLRGLLGALAAAPRGHEITALLAPGEIGATRWPGRVREVPVRAGTYGLTEHLVVPRAARRAGADLLHAPHYTLPLGWSGPSVVTIHDLTHVRYGRFFPLGAAVYARVMAGAAARRARRVIVDSSFGRDEVAHWLGVAADRVCVIPLGVSPAFAPAASGSIATLRAERALPARYLLYVGARKRFKNLELLLRALAALPAPDRPPLVLSGPAWAPGDPHARLAAGLGLGTAVHFAGDFADDGDLARLYSGAALLVHPSLTEGFGLPPLEAMACGTPVLCSNGGALPETVGDAARVLPPEDPEAWAEAIASLLRDEERRADLARRGRERAALFTWTRTAELTLAVYEEALAGA
jgi:glycosyltransferase involved in cell wall biosynthesis